MIAVKIHPMKSTTSLRFASLCILLGLAAPAAQAQYTNSFTHSGAVNKNLSLINWSAYGYSGTVFRDLTTTAGDPGTSDRAGITNVSGTTPSQSGFLFFANSATASYSFAGVTSDFAPFTLTGATWTSGSNNASSTIRVLIQQEGNWYASNGTFVTNPVVTSAGNYTTANASNHTFTFSTNAADWRAVTLDPIGGTLSVSGSVIGANLSSATITGFGFYASASANTVFRLDDLVVSGTAAVPEPSAFAALAGGLALGCAALRRRRA